MTSAQNRALAPSSQPAPTQLGMLHDRLYSALSRGNSIRQDLEAFAHRVGVGLPPKTEQPSGGGPLGTAVTHELHIGADDLHHVLSDIEKIAEALRQHA